MYRSLTINTLAVFLLLIPITAAKGQESPAEASSLSQALKEGQPIFNLRYRYEGVRDEAVGDKDARASTLRTVVGYRTLAYKGWSAYIEAENVGVIGHDLYRNVGAGSLSNGIVDRPVVADPALTEVNQAYLEWQGSGSQVRLGRQEVSIGDHRFVGNVGWRQNHQSFDACTFSNDTFRRVNFFYGYLDRVHRINGGSKELTGHAMNVGIELGSLGRLTTYGYWLDFENPGDFGLSSQTFGVELTNKRPLSATTTLLYELEFATQSDYGDNPNAVDADYNFAMLGVAFEPFTLKVGYEVLAGSPGRGKFTTPLATLHKFNGWADKFLATPAFGLEDLYLELSGTVGRVGWKIVYHDFGAQSSKADFGRELDLQLVYKTRWKQVFGLKGALYKADQHAADTDKWMLWTAFKI